MATIKKVSIHICSCETSGRFVYSDGAMSPFFSSKKRARETLIRA